LSTTMAFARASAIRGALKAARPSSTSVARPQVWRHIGRRSYASHGHESKKASSDLPWYVKLEPPRDFHQTSFDRILHRAFGALAVTVPSCWYLLQSGPDSHGHGDHGHGDAHGKGHGEEKHGKESKHGPNAAAESKEDDKDSEKSDESDSGDEGKDAETPDTSDDEDDGKSKDSGKDDETSDKGKKQGKPDDLTAEESADKVC
jgi:hypothetical protein